jgi:hypothetical protein
MMEDDSVRRTQKWRFCPWTYAKVSFPQSEACGMGDIEIKDYHGQDTI